MCPQNELLNDIVVMATGNDVPNVPLAFISNSVRLAFAPIVRNVQQNEWFIYSKTRLPSSARMLRMSLTVSELVHEIGSRITGGARPALSMPVRNAAQ